MKKRILIFCTVLFSSILSHAQITFQKTFGGAGFDVGNSVRQTTDGGYIIAGATASYGAGTFDIYLIKTNSSGDTLWTKTFGGSNEEKAYAVRQTTDGGYIIAGYSDSFSGGDEDVYLVKTDANGNSLWTKTYGGTSNESSSSVQQTTDGGYVMVGLTSSFGAGNLDIYVIKTDLNGDTLWTKTLGGSLIEYGQAIEQTSDGGYVISGYTESYGAGDYDLYLIRTDSSGNSLWSKTFGGADKDHGLSCQQTSDGGFIIAGHTESFGSGLSDVYLIKTDLNGDSLWTKAIGGSGVDLGYSVQQTANGGYCIASYSSSFNGTSAYLIQTDSIGDTLWTKSYNGPSNDAGYSAMQTADGGYILVGITGPSGDLYLIKTDSNGSSGCTHRSVPTLVTNTATQVSSPPATNSSTSTVVASPPTIVGSGGIINTRCTSVGMNEINFADFFFLSPNPSTGNFTISFKGVIRNGCIEIYNILGETVSKEIILNESKKEIRLNDISCGIYFIKVSDEAKQYTNKILIGHK